MPTSMRACSFGLFCGLAAVATWTAHGQSVTPQGSESRILVPFPGDQVYPAVSIRDQRGILAWEDNGIDRTDLGVAACRIDSSLAPVSEVFRVNYRRRGDQTRPAVALLPDGSAVFTFQGQDPSLRGRFGDTDAFIRFMGSDGRMIGKDYSLTLPRTVTRTSAQVTQPTWRKNRLLEKSWRIPKRVTLERSQTREAQPVILADGRVLVVYSGVLRYQTNTYEIATRITTQMYKGVVYCRTNDVLQSVRVQGDSKRDIFFRVFGANLKPSGPEFMVNQFTDNHQHQPAVAVWPDGRFVITWVSEEQMAVIPSDTATVGIRARLFSPDAQPLGDEFLVSAEDRICARPAVAAGQGTFTIVWNQRDVVRSNGWDICARSFDSQGVPVDEPFVVNTHRYGDQFSPSISGLGLSQLAVWTSLGQDGSRAGVFGRVLTQDGPGGREFQVNSTTHNQQIHPLAISDEEGRFTVFWSSFMGQDGFEIMRQVYLAIGPLPPPEPPAVAALDESRLQVSWSPVETMGLRHYELSMDELEAPNIVMDNQFVAEGLTEGSTHSFRLAYALTDGRRSLFSEKALGTTLGVPSDPAGGAGSSGALSGTQQLAGAGQNASADGTGTLGLLRVRIRFVAGGVELEWNTTPGTAYQVQISADLKSWLDFGMPRVATGGADAILINAKERVAWFRVVELP